MKLFFMFKKSKIIIEIMETCKQQENKLKQ